MKLPLATLFSLASLALAQAPSAVCPTATRTIQNRSCNKSCAYSDCTLQTTIRNPCGCPATVPTATLVAPCEADCPYQGCAIDIRTTAVACPTPSSSSTRRTTSTSSTIIRRTSTSTTSTPTGVITSVITLPPKSTTTTSTTSLPCPRVTRTTSPADCPTIRCPVPTCRVSSTMVVPCGCEPRTAVYVTGCATACSEGCLTRTATRSIAC